MFHRTSRYNQLKKVEGNTRRIKSASQKAILLHMAEKLDKIRSYTYQSMFGPVEMVFFLPHENIHLWSNFFAVQVEKVS